MKEGKQQPWPALARLEKRNIVGWLVGGVLLGERISSGLANSSCCRTSGASRGDAFGPTGSDWWWTEWKRPLQLFFLFSALDDEKSLSTRFSCTVLFPRLFFPPVVLLLLLLMHLVSKGRNDWTSRSGQSSESVDFVSVQNRNHSSSKNEPSLSLPLFLMLFPLVRRLSTHAHILIYTQPNTLWIADPAQIDGRQFSDLKKERQHVAHGRKRGDQHRYKNCVCIYYEKKKKEERERERIYDDVARSVMNHLSRINIECRTRWPGFFFHYIVSTLKILAGWSFADRVLYFRKVNLRKMRPASPQWRSSASVVARAM